MTTLSTYTFAAGTDLSNVKLRGFATGRYTNNSGSAQNMTFTATWNTVVLISQAVSVPTSTAAQAWNAWLHVYFGTNVAVTGKAPTLGASFEAKISNAVNTGFYTGNYMAANAMQVYSTPLTTFIDPTAQNTITFVLTPAGAGGEVLQIDMAYLEAL